MHVRFTVLLSLAMAAGLVADPAWRKELTTPAPGALPAVRTIAPSVLDFEVSWKGLLDAGKLRIEFAPKDADKPGMLVVRSNAASTGAASALFPYRSHFWSEVHPATLRPRFFHAVETDRREKITTTVHYRPRQVEFDENSEFLKKKESARKQGVFRFEPVYDIFSALLFVRAQKLAPGDRVTLVVQPFKTPYLVRVRVIARERHMDRPAIRLAVAMQKIDRDTLELRPYRKMRREAGLWLSDDADRVPLELRAAVFIGDVRAVLANFRKLQP
ncbi:MAG TPA: DUF3108 domain-containing protein [Luteolibacter sp.]|nr:DUF3108 domain-containing protein [Luteolibacter sp.]